MIHDNLHCRALDSESQDFLNFLFKLDLPVSLATVEEWVESELEEPAPPSCSL